MQVGLADRVNASMGIVTEAGAGDRQDRGQDDCPPSPLAWLIITGSGRWTRTEDSWVVEQRVGLWAMSCGTVHDVFR